MNCVGCIFCRIYLFCTPFYHHGSKLFFLSYLFVHKSGFLACMPLLQSYSWPWKQICQCTELCLEEDSNSTPPEKDFFLPKGYLAGCADLCHGRLLYTSLTFFALHPSNHSWKCADRNSHYVIIHFGRGTLVAKHVKLVANHVQDCCKAGPTLGLLNPDAFRDKHFRPLL